MKPSKYLVVSCFCFFLLGFGCTTAPIKNAQPINLTPPPPEQRLIYIQGSPDPGIYQQTSPETIMIIDSVREQLVARGYTVVATPGTANYCITLQLTSLNYTDNLQPPKPAQPSGNNLPVVGDAAGTAIGGALSGSALHGGLTTGGSVGGAVGAGVGILFDVLDSGPTYQTLPDFVGTLNFRLTGKGLDRISGVNVIQKMYGERTQAGTIRIQKLVAARLAKKLTAALPQLFSQ